MWHCAGVLACVIWLASGGQALAQDAGGWLDRVNRGIFALNEAVFDQARALRDYIPSALTPSDDVAQAAEAFMVNTINEPLTAASHAIAGNYQFAARSLQRFGTNIVLGYGGFVDRASEYGITVPRLDIGLALCERGVPDGPYVVLPFVGARTMRDAVADIIISNVLIYAMLIPVIGTAPSLTTFVVIEILDEAAAVALARQIDAMPHDETAHDYDATRAAYLARRAQRCGAGAG